jgi:ATP-dependent RNA helicase DDX41
VDQAVELIRQKPQKTKDELQKAEEERVMADVLAAQRRLQSDRELAKGIAYTETLKTSWSLPSHLAGQDAVALQKKYLIQVEGENVVPPIRTFREMRIVQPLLDFLRKKRGIKKPTPIQMQGLPVILRYL